MGYGDDSASATACILCARTRSTRARRLGRGLWALMMLGGCSVDAVAESPAQPLVSAERSAARVQVLPRGGAIAGYPCSQCHDKIDPALLQAGPAKGHHGVQQQHFAESGRCVLCHRADAMDTLTTLAGKQVAFDEAYLVCGQCHGEKLRDFHIGAHGKSVGSWRDMRQRYNCTGCHDPHAPFMPTVEAEPPPIIGAWREEVY